jgi:hypothetical protein
MGSTYQSTVLNAPIDKVWAAVRDFHDLSWSANVVEKVEVIGDKSGDQIGAQRVLNDAFHETLLGLDDVEHTIRYSIDDGPSPVSKDDIENYIGCVRLSSVTDSNSTFIEWSSSWEKKGEADCGDFCHNIYLALLADLGNHFS